MKFFRFTMNFEETVEWLYSFQKHGIKLGLERITHISKKLGNPEKSYKTIHVGGTNGKGSVCRFLESIIDDTEYSVGVNTSPHIQNITERIVVNKKRITEEELITIVEKVKPIAEDMIQNNKCPTFFEVFTAIAFEYFKEKKVDFAILEVGLGGRFDATNIIDPVVSVITNVTLDHQNILGEKIEDIAFEKAGIIKEKKPVITAANNKALEVIKKIAIEKKSELKIINKTQWQRIKKDDLGQDFIIKTLLNEYNVNTKLLGEFNGENIAIAVEVIELLQNQGYNISNNSILNGIKSTFNPGRMEIINQNPIILLDGAHNTAGMNILAETIKKDFEYEKLILILGILKDKNIEGMLSIILPLANIVIVTKSNNIRACDAAELSSMIIKIGFSKDIIVKDEIKDAINHAKSIAEKKDLICVTGSLFTIGEARDILVGAIQKC